MKNRIYFINFENSKLVDSNGANLLAAPTLTAGSKPTLEFHFCTFANDERVDMDLSEASKFQMVVDKDLSIDTDPLVFCKSTDAVTSGISSGIVEFPLDCSGSGFVQAVNGKDNVSAWGEIYGLDSNDVPIYDYRFKLSLLGTILFDHSETESEPESEEP